MQKPWHTEFINEEEVRYETFSHCKGHKQSTQFNSKKLHYWSFSLNTDLKNRTLTPG